MKKYLLISMVLVFLFGCEDPYKDSTYQAYDLYPASTYLDSRPDDFSEWVKILKYADLYNAVNQASKSYTLFAPDNAAVAAFYAKNNVSSIEEMGLDYAKALVRFHIIDGSISRGTFLVGGKITTPTVSEDYLTVTFDESGESEGGVKSVLLNNEALVTELANEVTNGYVYVLDGVLTPLVETIYDRLRQNADYSIFKEAVEQTAWAERLNTVYDTLVTESGYETVIKRNFTLFPVSNQTFALEGVSNLSGLVSKLGAGSDYTSDENALRQYVSYHILSKTSYVEDLYAFTSDELTNIFSTQASKQVISTNEVDGMRYVNYDENTQEGISLVDGKTDILAKNGILHEVAGYMPVFSPNPMTVVWDFCDFDDIASVVNAAGASSNLGDIYQTAQSSEYKISFYSEEVTSYTWKANSSASTASYPTMGYLVTKTSDGGLTNSYKAYKHDMMFVNLGYLGNFTVNTPVVLKGKYKVELFYACASSLADFISGGSLCKFSLDDTSSEVYVYKGASASVGIYSLTLFDSIEFDSTDQREFKLVLLDPRATTHSAYRLQLDYVKFTPITE